ncbi:Fic family protein [Collinsella sp. An2]|uniref:Fic family protein n=1 Tax=Collinsella sp. An2 TaxID=1965585 RepID=UPI000B39071E|nr:Fic family protein [Collinsella sp. An2]OUP10905.1 hypothetical protein B5F33_00515 [Collinsella sp. An2]
MAYRTLEKTLHADRSSERFEHHDELFRQRFTSESTFRTGILLDTGELFLAVPRELSVVNEQVLRRERRVSALWRGLPTVALCPFIRSLIMDEVVYSNEIEGVHSTRREIELALDQAQRDSSVLKNVATKEHAPFIEFAKLYLGLTENPKPPQTLQDIRNIYDAVVSDALDSRDRLGDSLFRTGQVVVERADGRVLHTGVAPEQKIEDMLTQWLELSERDDMPETYRAILCHFLFGYIHPFYDGNGRTGRYLLSLQLSEPLSQPTVLSLSRTIAENKAAYYRAFDTTERPLNRAEGTHFVLTMLGLVAEAQEDLIANLEEKRTLLQLIEDRLKACEGRVSQRALDVLYYAAQMEVFDAFQETRMSEVVTWLGVSVPTVRRAFDELVSEGLLVRVSKRPPVFRLTEQSRGLLGLTSR